MDFSGVFSVFKEWLTSHGFELLGVFVFILLGIYLSLKLSRIIEKALVQKNVDKAVSSLIRKLLFYSLAVLIVMAGLNRLGVNTASLLTLIGAMGLAVGLALKDSFSHFASGILIVIFRPFTIGDYIKVEGYEGFVDDIGVFHTRLKTRDNASVVIPNSSITNTTVINYTREGKRRVDITFGIGYGDDIRKAKEIILNIAQKHKFVLNEPKPSVVVSELGDSAVNLQVRAWVKTENYWDVYFDLIEMVKIEFDNLGITIPYPQLDVHLDK